MHKYRDLVIWKKSIDLAVNIYKITAKFPKEEMYGLTSQIRRSSVSIPSNIAEGAYRNSNNEFVHFLGIANGSAAEVDTQITIAHHLAFITREECETFWNDIDHLQRMNYNLQDNLKQKNKSK